MNRITWIDQFRGLAIFFVILSHTCRSYNWLYTYSMLPMFFYISGYLHKSVIDYKVLFNRLFKRLYIPLLFFGLLPNLFNLLKYKELFPVKDYFIGIVLGINVGWFIPCLMVVELIVFFVDYIIKKFTLNDLLIYIIMIIFSISFMFLVEENSHCPWAADTALASIGFYYVGIIIKRFESLGKLGFKIRKSFLYLCLFFFLLLSYIAIHSGFYFNLSINRISNPPVIFLLGIMSCFIFMSLVKAIDLGPLFTWMGINSLFLYYTNIYLKPICIFLFNLFHFDILLFPPYISGLVLSLSQVILAYPFISFVNKYTPILVGVSKVNFKTSKLV